MVHSSLCSSFFNVSLLLLTPHLFRKRSGMTRSCLERVFVHHARSPTSITLMACPNGGYGAVCLTPTAAPAPPNDPAAASAAAATSGSYSLALLVGLAVGMLVAGAAAGFALRSCCCKQESNAVQTVSGVCGLYIFA